MSIFEMRSTAHFGYIYSGHLGPPLSGYYIRLASISDLTIIEKKWGVGYAPASKGLSSKMFGLWQFWECNKKTPHRLRIDNSP